MSTQTTDKIKAQLQRKLRSMIKVNREARDEYGQFPNYCGHKVVKITFVSDKDEYGDYDIVANDAYCFYDRTKVNVGEYHIMAYDLVTQHAWIDDECELLFDNYDLESYTEKYQKVMDERYAKFEAEFNAHFNN